ncbi:MAG: hypothetical protein M3Z09_09980 [Acidobacteriota bacterium]|nr:hypothetical protein [Acidobacteriota bacterium]
MRGFYDVAVEREGNAVPGVGWNAFVPENLRDYAKDRAAIPEVMAGANQGDPELAERANQP